MSTAASRHPAPAFASTSARAHPYSRASATSSSSHSHSARRASPPPPLPREERLPPSPPRSHHDASASPPVDKASIDPNDNYWDDVPAPPASLKSILDSFRRSGEGDRDLLMAILGAKKSEEERLTSIIQTRLTILQARLNLAAIQAQMPPPPPAGMPPSAAELCQPRQERTPSLSHASTSDAASPRPAPQYYYQPRDERERVQLPPMGFYGRDRGDRSERGERERERERSERSERLPPLRDDRRDSRGPPSPRQKSPDARGGLEMLLEGVREAERKERV